MEPLLLELHQRGHHLTVVSSFPQKTPLENYTDIDFSSQFPPPTSTFTLETIRNKMPNYLKTVIFFIEYHIGLSEEVLKSQRVLDLVGEKFDLVIGEIFGDDTLTYISHKMKVPYIGWVTSTPLPWIAFHSDIPDNPAYIPNFFVSLCSDMTLFQRIYNAVSLYYAKVMYHILSEIPSQKIAEKVFKEKLPSMRDINQKTSLILVNSHFSLSKSRPFPPNYVEVGGIHIKKPKSLPKDIQEFLDGAYNGAVLFSFGSIVRLSSLPPPTVRKFLNVISNMPQRFIMKYEEELPDAPPNVMYMKWLPQSDILAHPNVRAFVSHGGQASTMEAVYFAKPLVAVPFFGDQYHNANNVVCSGAAILLDIDNFSQADFLRALSAVLNDSWYIENMKRLSHQFRDRPMTALQTAVYWTEYVIRHQGAPHLRPASVNVPLYQYLLLDVIAVLAVWLASLFLVLYWLIRLTFYMRTPISR
ncbi:UDP-glucosyltransferase 2-like [Homalodisca vitripennis]|uniref:UDP-glucosyltransferase 2-like n=1 Tax=Homalodisca vitripennis TaxID=197043 RepID=UPI001EEBF086|nr:UDP-glucosyltransferase 2-like [Homalodisca vitripennis]